MTYLYVHCFSIILKSNASTKFEMFIQNCFDVDIIKFHKFLFRECTRSGFCNFMHLKPISRELRRELYGRHRKRR